MGKFLATLTILTAVFLLVAYPAKALTEEEEGAQIWQKLNSSQLKCEGISDDQFERLGEFFMGRMTGLSHEAMDKQMEQMMGKEGLEQMHMAMGKRMSGCQINATAPGINGNMMNFGMMGMIRMMQGGGGQFMMGPGMMKNGPVGDWAGQNWGMMGSPGAFWVWSILSWITWILVIVALVAFIRWMWKKGDK